MKIISRSEAKQLGLRRYYTGKACRNGHLCEKYVRVAKCIECNKIQHDKSLSKNPEKAKILNSVKFANYRSKKLGIEDKITVNDIKSLIDEQHDCIGCMKLFNTFLPWSLDHKKPLSQGGSNKKDNIQLLCLPCNIIKGERSTEEWQEETMNQWVEEYDVRNIL